MVIGAVLLTTSELYRTRSELTNENQFVREEFVASDVHEYSLDFFSGLDLGLAFFRDELYRPVVQAFYANHTNSDDISAAILHYADKYNISASLAFALAWKESNFQPGATHVNDSGSIDRGLFQLNSKYFITDTEEEIFNIQTNASMGLAHFRYCLDQGENEVVALAFYNAGKRRVTVDGTPLRTLNYVQKVLNYRDQLDKDLLDFINFYQSSFPLAFFNGYHNLNLTQTGPSPSLYP